MSEAFIQSWFPKAAEMLVRGRKTMNMVVLELKLDLTAKEAEDIFKSKSFQEVLRLERHRFWNELASDPGFGKNSVIGQMLECVYMLTQEGNYEKALDGLNKLASIAGWKGAETNINVFENVSAKDIADIKAQLEQNRPTKRPSEASN